MKNTVSKALIICGITVMTALTTVGATTLYQTIEATLRPDITVKLDNNALSLKDSVGKSITPVIIDGSTYLPIRAISNSIGLNVDWDENTQTIYLKKDNLDNQIQKIGVRGTVKNIVNGKDGITFLVEGQLDEDTQYSAATVTANRDTTVINEGLDVKRLFDFTEIKEGNIVEVIFKGEVSKANPVMAVAERVIIKPSSSNVNAKVKAPDITGKILEVQKDGKRILVESKNTSINGQIWVAITDETNFFENLPENVSIGYRNVSRNFEVGNYVEIIIDGPVLESYPMQTAASAVAVNEKR